MEEAHDFNPVNVDFLDCKFLTLRQDIQDNSENEPFSLRSLMNTDSVALQDKILEVKLKENI